MSLTCLKVGPWLLSLYASFSLAQRKICTSFCNSTGWKAELSHVLRSFVRAIRSTPCFVWSHLLPFVPLCISGTEESSRACFFTMACHPSHLSFPTWLLSLDILSWFETPREQLKQVLLYQSTIYLHFFHIFLFDSALFCLFIYIYEIYIS